jgi:hypothetical protein
MLVKNFRKFRSCNIPILVVLAVFVLTSAGYANVLAPGDCAGAGANPACPGTVTNFGTDPSFFPTNALADTGVVAFTGVGGLYSGTYDEIVAKDNTTGNMDFIFQIHNNAGSTDAIGRITTVPFDHFTTDVGYSSTVFITAMGAGTRFPDTVDRSLAGDVVGFNFLSTSSAGELMPGQTTDLLVIKTNAPTFTGGFINTLDGDIARFPGFAPTPEPAFYGLLSLGMGGLFVMSFRRTVSKNRSL